MKKDGLLFAIIYAVIFVPIIAMLVMAGISIASAESISSNPRPAVTPAVMPISEPIAMPLPTSEPTATPVAELASTSYYDLRMDATYVMPGKASESRLITINLKCDDPDGKVYSLIPNMIISPVDLDNLDQANDDWVYCLDEWETIKLEPGEKHMIRFDILPPEGTPSGEYEFTYTLCATPSNLDLQNSDEPIGDKIESSKITIIVNIT